MTEARNILSQFKKVMVKLFTGVSETEDEEKGTDEDAGTGSEEEEVTELMEREQLASGVNRSNEAARPRMCLFMAKTSFD